ncbi:type II toxin-antitoxin system VapB family antitoxin [Mycobacterium avium subsp. hominissuis]|jgi:Arc/MetJ family transcription regulator|uniref:DUF2191 domain-containing protein n=4 Tax=Mycobacterium avium complex (MAC) TaxID=120793 RepID=A0AAW5S245_MYCBC|nr:MULTISPECIES: type II toxin-antitoxin system VapB family antitoxin [Mycobacterium avium complex (MAC)]ETA93848.1 hypothetical protein O984_08020 [Mycobacterium avium 05-4293]ETB12037.1 hypothetical protein P863_07585 [Mycobacterium avium subsp. silvaticum ATCC 49884]ETB18866.1 hypothetical protein O972_06575 [Mycobacterium avium subsp. avium 10-9275]ETB22848.1 hypothetical protein O973_06345 [Mycobacterium avium subsp. avium 11-4751]ETB27136.1 hypothetical protein O983_06510 [Mycobacterium 
MKKTVEIEVDVNMIDDAIRRFHLADAREAVNLALRTLIDDAGPGHHDGEFGDLGPWRGPGDIATNTG